MPGPIRVGAPTRIRHIPLSWPVEKARSNHQPKFRPVNDTVLRGREVTVGEVMEQMFAAMPSPNDWIDGISDAGAYYQEATEVAEPFRVRIAEMLQVTFNEGALLGQDSIRADINVQLERLGSPLRLTGEDGRVTKRGARVEEVAVEHLGRNPKSRWAPIGVEAFDVVDAKSVQYAQFRSGTLVTNMVEEQQRVVRGLIGESFTVQQTFQTGRTVTGLTAQQTAHALVEVLQEVNPTSQIGQNLAKFRGVNANGLTRPWEKAVYRRAETLADRLGRQGVTGVKAQMRIQKDAQRYADKLRRSRARMISRTEIKNAQVQGRLESFRQTVNDGLADPATAGKQWVTGATDVCSICSELGMSKPISLDNSFEGGFDGPTAHPNCRCDVMFVHDIANPPKAVPAGDPAYRPGTPENPITWEFPSGFKTQPSATTAFTPPGFVPPTPPVAVGPPQATAPVEVAPQPVDVPAPVQVAPTPAQSVGSNADLVWDDAGRKWANLTSDEQLFLLDSHTDDVLRQALEEIIEAEVRLSGGATLPPLADDATLIAEGLDPAAVKAIRKQQEKVVQQIRDFTRNDVMERLAYQGSFRDELYTLLDDTIDVAGTGYRIQNGNRSVVRLLGQKTDDVLPPVELPWSNRGLARPGGDPLAALADPDSPIHLQRAWARMIGEGNDFGPYRSPDGLGLGIAPRFGREIAEDITTAGWRERRAAARLVSRAELELEVSKLGTLARAEADRMLGPVEAYTPAESWITRTVIRADESIDDAYEAIHAQRKLAQKRLKDPSLGSHISEGGRFRWPDRRGRPRPGATPGRFGLRTVDPASVQHLDDAYYAATEGVMDRVVIETVSEILDDLGAAGYLDDITEQILWSDREPIEEAIRQVTKLIDDMARDGLIGPGTSMSTEQALAFLDPADATGLLARTVAKIGDGSTMVTQAREALAPVSAAMDAIEAGVSSRIMATIETFWGTAAPEYVTLTGQIKTYRMLGSVARALKDGVVPDTMALGRLSTLRPVTGRHADDAVRAAINQVMRQVREIGGDEFRVLSGETVNFYGKPLKAMDPTRAGNERVARTVEEMRRQADEWMPTEWIERANERGGTGFYNAGGDRSHYAETGRNLSGASGDGMINAGTRNLESLGDRTAFHEITHRVQKNVPVHGELEDAFWFRQTRLPDRPAGITDDQWAEIEKLYEWRRVGGGSKEIGIKDEFYDSYVGKWYDTKGAGNRGYSPDGDGALEMSPMSITHLAGSGSDAARPLAQDLSAIDWILGMMLGL